MPHNRNVLVTGGNVRAMLICSSSYAVRGFPYILLFAFYTANSNLFTLSDYIMFLMATMYILSRLFVPSVAL